MLLRNELESLVSGKLADKVIGFMRGECMSLYDTNDKHDELASPCAWWGPEQWHDSAKLHAAFQEIPSALQSSSVTPTRQTTSSSQDQSSGGIIQT